MRTMGEDGRSLNPAASKGRMVVALGVLLVLGVLSWSTIDASTVMHVHGYTSRFVSYDDRDVQLRWMPILFLGLFAFRVVTAHMRARLEERKSKDTLM
ncbi:MAG: hypothetical protein M3R43_00215 [Acidobacteriota bacterium]|nr:hypothetical protein [Acidobacteriota bacterium]